MAYYASRLHLNLDPFSASGIPNLPGALACCRMLADVGVVTVPADRASAVLSWCGVPRAAKSSNPLHIRSSRQPTNKKLKIFGAPTRIAAVPKFDASFVADWQRAIVTTVVMSLLDAWSQLTLLLNSLLVRTIGALVAVEVARWRSAGST